MHIYICVCISQPLNVLATVQNSCSTQSDCCSMYPLPICGSNMFVCSYAYIWIWSCACVYSHLPSAVQQRHVGRIWPLNSQKHKHKEIVLPSTHPSTTLINAVAKWTRTKLLMCSCGLFRVSGYNAGQQKKNASKNSREKHICPILSVTGR